MDRCDLCGLCIRMCRRSALTTYIVQDCATIRIKGPEECAGCGRCMKNCPLKAIELIEYKQ
ncbi:MAG: 4Fe-4S binding protein [Tannerellaceae bacterium]|nr:4Fe-4S binding protein [Tannerellaceae bacterium]